MIICFNIWFKKALKRALKQIRTAFCLFFIMIKRVTHIKKLIFGFANIVMNLKNILKKSVLIPIMNFKIKVSKTSVLFVITKYVFIKNNIKVKIGNIFFKFLFILRVYHKINKIKL